MWRQKLLLYFMFSLLCLLFGYHANFISALLTLHFFMAKPGFGPVTADFHAVAQSIRQKYPDLKIGRLQPFAKSMIHEHIN